MKRLGFAVAAAALFLLGLWALGSPWVEGYLVSRLPSWAERRGIDLAVERLDLDPWSLAVTATGLAAEGGGGAWAVRSARLQFELLLLRSLTGRPCIRLDLRDPEIVVVAGGEGGAARDTGRARRSPDSLWPVLPVVLDSLGVERGSVRVESADGAWHVRLPVVEADWRGGAGTVSVRGGTLGWGGLEEALDHLQFQGRSRFSGLQLDTLEVATEHGTLGLAGAVGPWNRLDLESSLRLDLRALSEPWLEALGLAAFRPVGTVVELAGTLTGEVTDPLFEGHLAARDARFGPLESSAIDADLELDLRQVLFRDLRVAADFADAVVERGRLNWESALLLEAEGVAERYDLREFMELFMPSGFPVGLVAAGRFSAQGPLYPNLALAGQVSGVRVRDLDVSVDREGETRTYFALPRGEVDARCLVGRRQIEIPAATIRTADVTVQVRDGEVRYTEGLRFRTDVDLRGLAPVHQYVPDSFHAVGTARGEFGGPYRELVFDYDLDLAETVVWGVDLGRLRGPMEYDLAALTTTGTVLEGPLGRLSLAGRFALARDVASALDVTATGVDLETVAAHLRPRLPALPPDLAGSAELQGTVGGALLDWTWQGSVAARDLRAWGLPVSSLRLRGRADLGSWGVEQLHGAGLGGTLEAQAEGDWQAFRATGTLADLDPAVAGRHLGRPLPVGGRLGGEFSASGPYRDPRLEFTGTWTALQLAGQDLGPMAVSGRVAADALVARGGLWQDALQLEASVGFAAPHPYAVRWLVAGLELERLPAAWRQQGMELVGLSGEGRLGGQLASSPPLSEAVWELHAERLQWGALQVDGPRAAGEYREDGATFTVDAWDGRAQLRGLYARAPGLPLELEGFLDALPTAALGVWTPEDAGRLSAKASALVSLEELTGARGWGRAAALAELDLTGSVWNLADGGDSGRLSFRAQRQEEAVSATLTGLGLDLQAAFTDLESGRWTAEATFDGCALAGLPLPPGPASDLRGTLDGRIRAAGSGRRLESAEGEGILEGLAWRQLVAQRWDWDLAWARQELSLRAREHRGVQANLTWQPDAATRLRVVAVEVPLRGWVAADALPVELQGTVNGVLEMERRPGADWDGSLRLDRLRVRLDPVDVQNSGLVEVGYREGAVEFRSFHLTGSGLDAVVAGQLRPGRDWDLTGDLHLDLANLPPLIEGVDGARGSAGGEVTIQGPWAAPQLRGPVWLGPAARIQLGALERPLEALRGKAFFDGDRGLSVEVLEADYGGGRVRAEGTLALRGLRPESLIVYVELRDIEHAFPPQVDLRFDADLLLTGTPQRPELRGEIRLQEFLYARRLNWKSMLLKLLQRRPRDVATGGEAGQVFVDLSVRGDDNLRVDNNLAELELAVDLRARGHLPRPALWGRVEVTDGSVRLRSLEYAMDRSSVEFLGQRQPLPLLDLHARTEVSEYTVNVDITGPLDDYQVSVASSPPLPRTDIIALLTLGTRAEDVAGGQSVTAAEAASFLTGQLQDELESGVGGVFGFDQFQIDPSYSTTAQTTAPRVTVGKAITKEMFARYSAIVGTETEQDLEVQYSLTPRVSLLGTWIDRGRESQGSLGGEIRFRFTFR